MQDKFLQLQSYVLQKEMHYGFLILQSQDLIVKALTCFPMDNFFIGLLAHDFLTLPILFLRANDKHINSTISTLSFQAFEIMECIGIFCWTQNRCPHVSLTLECIATSLAYRWGGVS